MTVDTEGDNQWDHGIPLATENVHSWRPFQDICRRHGVPPTYLLTSEIVADPAAVQLLRGWVETGEAEVGAHLHPWTTPPFADKPGFRENDRSHAFISELPEDLVRAKLERLTLQIQERLGIRPTAFRGGRFGMNDAAAKALAELGFTVDSSVTPLTSWTMYPGLPNGNGGPDFRSHSSAPFVIAGTGEPGLLEIPITIVITSTVLRHFPRLLTVYDSLPVRAISRASGRRLFRPARVWLYPARFEYTVEDMERACDLQMRDSGIAVMMVHSSELMPGGSPWTPTPRSIETVLHRLDTFLAFAHDRGAVGMTLSAAAAEVRTRGNQLLTLPLQP